MLSSFLQQQSLLMLLLLYYPLTMTAAARTVIPVKYGYFPESRPSHAACARGWLDLDDPGSNTYYQVTCYPQTSGNFAAARLDNLQLDVANLGSTPWAMAAARGVDAQTVYVSHYMGDSQGLYVKDGQGTDDMTSERIATPFDLQGKSIGVPFGSTMHYQILFLIDLLELDQVNLVNMAPSEIIKAWEENTIDAAGCWGAARVYVLQHNGRTLASAGLLSSWGRPTYVVTAATRTFAREHPLMVQHMVGVLSRINDSFLDNLGQNDELNVARWDAGGAALVAGDSLVPSMVDALMLPDETARQPSEDALFLGRNALNKFVQHHAREQISCDYLGTQPRQCSSPTLQHIATRQTAEFLLDQKVLASLGPLERMGDTEQCQDENTFCGGDLYDGTYLAGARQECASCHLVGPYGGDVPLVSSTLEEGQIDAFLLALEQQDRSSNRSPYALDEAGRDPDGNSNCIPEAVLSANAPVVGTLGDGANAIPGLTYSVNLNCRWVLRGWDCVDPSTDNCQDVVDVELERLRVWSGDYIRVYSDPTHDCTGNVQSMTLLGQFTGVYDAASVLPPRLAARGCLAVVFTTDPNQEQIYGTEEGNGFLMRYNRNARGCDSNNDCENGGTCSDGLCECNGRGWGATCSETNTCFGKTEVFLREGGRVLLASSTSLFSHDFAEEESNKRALDPALVYPNDLDCTFDIHAPLNHEYVKVSLHYDLEASYDLLYLQSGLGQRARPYAVLTGTHGGRSVAKEYYVPTEEGRISLRLKTDTHGRRVGFRAVVEVFQGNGSDECSPPGQTGFRCEFDHCIAQSWLRPGGIPGARNDPYMLGRVVSQSQGPVPAMPWAEQGGCVWSLLPNFLPSGVENIAGFRFVFNEPMDLEPQRVADVKDRLVFRKQRVNDELGTETKDIAFFVEECNSDEVCSYPWQTGVCGESGGCIVKPSIEVDYSLLDQTDSYRPYAALVTDRNDLGINYKGLDFDVFLVQQCPPGEGETHCEAGGGECLNGGCFCQGIPCNCPCDGENPTSISTGVKIGIVMAVIIPIFVILLILFLWYRRRKIRKSRAQKQAIKEKEAELEAFRDSIVGMCTAIKKYIPVVHAEIGEEMPVIKPPVTPSVWCWKETPSCMGPHSADTIVGDPADCWIKYNEDATAKLEASYTEQGGAGTFSPQPGYIVNFSTMIQTKVATGFEREVNRIAGSAAIAPSDTDTDVDLSDLEFGSAIPDDLSEEPRMVLVEGDVIQISKKRNDGWAFGTKLQHADEGLARQLVVVATSGNPTIDDSSILTDTGWFEIEATRMPTTEDLALLQSRIGDTGELDAPENWEPVVDPTIAQQHVLPAGHPERTAVETAFLSSLHRNAKIERVERIQNLSMWQSYVVKRQTICYRETEQNDDESADPVKQAQLKKMALERFERCWLWHGTNVEVKGKILQQGFNRSFCGKNATVYGKGVYFARDSSYSSDPTYAVRDSSGLQYIMACRVVVGEYCQGQYNALTPDLRDAKKNILYDTTVGLLKGDTMKNPSIYVTYHDAQAYPEYLIVFRAY